MFSGKSLKLFWFVIRNERETRIKVSADGVYYTQTVKLNAVVYLKKKK